MKTVVKKSIKKKWAIPGESLSMDEFKKGIAEAEDGPFFTIEESKKMIEQWRVQKNSR